MDAVTGLPAHLTMLYPFLEPTELTPGVRRSLADVARRHRTFDYTLRGIAAWPDTVYVAVAPATPFVRLQRDLQAAFPAYPIYGLDTGFQFVPHVTIAEGSSVDDAGLRGHPAWRPLPRPGRAAAIEVIATGPDGWWRLVWRMLLGAGGHGRRSSRR